MKKTEIIADKIKETYNKKLKIYIDEDLIKIKKNSVIGLYIYVSKNEVTISRFIPNFFLRILPFSEMFFLAIFYIPSSDFKKEIETLIKRL